MAKDFDDDMFDDEEGEVEGAETGGKGSGKKVILFVVIGVVLVAIIVAVVVSLLLNKNAAAPTSLEETLSEQDLEIMVQDKYGKPLTYDAGDIYVNVSGTRSTRVLKFRPYLEVKDQSTLDNLNNVETLRQVIRDKIMSVARTMSFDELEGPNGADILKSEIRGNINRSLKKRIGGEVITVHFNDFLIQ